MAYEPTVWADGDVITAEKLNNLEQGVGSGSTFIVNADMVMPDEGEKISITADKTYTDIVNAMESGKEIKLIVRDVTDQRYNAVTTCSLTSYVENAEITFCATDGEETLCIVFASGKEVKAYLYRLLNTDDIFFIHILYETDDISEYSTDFNGYAETDSVTFDRVYQMFEQGKTIIIRMLFGEKKVSAMDVTMTYSSYSINNDGTKLNKKLYSYVFNPYIYDFQFVSLSPKDSGSGVTIKWGPTVSEA